MTEKKRSNQPPIWSPVNDLWYNILFGLVYKEETVDKMVNYTLLYQDRNLNQRNFFLFPSLSLFPFLSLVTYMSSTFSPCSCVIDGFLPWCFHTVRVFVFKCFRALSTLFFSSLRWFCHEKLIIYSITLLT